VKRRVSSMGAALAIAWAVVVPPSPVPVSSPEPEAPQPSAEAWSLYDANAGVFLAGENGDVSRPMASVTKVMTALVVVDNASLTDRVRISPTAAGVGEAEIGVVPGELWTVHDLLYAMLVRSANDAAVALAEHVAGSEPEFADMMDAKATELGLTGSDFANPHGLDEEGHFSTADDLAVLGAELLENDALAEMVRTRIVKFRPAPNGAARIVRNTNRLLGAYPELAGVKTGFTGRAGRVLISAVETPERLVVGVVMGSEDHFADSREVLDYGAHLVTYADRWTVPLMPEQGGSGTVDEDLDDALVARLAAVPELWDGSGEVTELAATAAGRALEDLLREHLPVLLGGTG
jgi:D-alanyl-D-alanine carboxypeptidase (penicillin-binding protein 5/6)